MNTDIPEHNCQDEHRTIRCENGKDLEECKACGHQWWQDCIFELDYEAPGFILLGLAVEEVLHGHT